jgi:hypothetical protein
MCSYLNGDLFIAFWAGFILKGRYAWDYDPQYYALQYMGWVVLPHLLIFTSPTLKWTKMMVLDPVIAVFGWHSLQKSLRGDILGMNGRVGQLTSPLMLWAPIGITAFTLYYKAYRKRGPRRRENERMNIL